MVNPHYVDDSVTLLHGDCIEVLRELPAESVDAVVTDPPYGLEFMGRDWDGADGFRRSLNAADAGRESVFGRASRTSPEYRAGALFQQWCEAWSAECLRVLKPGGHLVAFGGTRTAHRLTCGIEDAGFDIRDGMAWLYGSGFPKSLNVGNGQGTALKPANEPITVARKPLAGTVAANLLTYGTGALNIDACRTHPGSATPGGGGWAAHQGYVTDGWNRPYLDGASKTEGHDLGRWPANVALTHSPWCETHCQQGCPVAELDAQSGVLTSGANPTRRGSDKFRDAYGDFKGQSECSAARGADSGGASRFFPTFRYEAKAPATERPRTAEGVAHPTVKPLGFMQWLVRLFTPAGGTVLEPFAGSGTTAEACVIEGLKCIAIEREAAYLPLITARLTKPLQPSLDIFADQGS